ncbi:MAG: hypothetical protein ACTSVI_14175 [Promethearchaeota archaeon]
MKIGKDEYSWKEEAEEYRKAQQDVDNMEAACELFAEKKVAPSDRDRAILKCMEKWLKEDQMINEEDMERWGLKKKT